MHYPEAQEYSIDYFSDESDFSLSDSELDHSTEEIDLPVVPIAHHQSFKEDIPVVPVRHYGPKPKPATEKPEKKS